MRSPRSSCLLIAVLLLLAPRLTPRLAAQEPQSRIVPALLGGVAGIAGGGYIALATVVLESRFGRYIHDEKDFFGWHSVPVLAGATIGTAVGLWDPDRLYRTVLFGAAGFGAGIGLGVAAGDLFGETPEARWAGGAIGAGIGLIIGNTLGIVLPSDAGPAQVNTQEVRVPVVVRIPF
jgi:hypothetical protein